MLFNWLFAKRYGGVLVLRVEDTDQARSTLEHEKMILSDIARLGLDYQEGPDKGGDYGPYRQSERLSIYGKYARQLLEQDKVYYCFCSEELLTQKREAAMKLGRTPHYDGTCARISLADAQARLKKGDRAGLRFRAPQKSYVLNDHVRGRVEFKEGIVGDFFVTRTPKENESEIAEGIGMPVYNFCCVIDDYLMKMSHIIRGEDHLSNTARQLMIYEAFNWKTPEFAHIAMVLGSDRQKLSKRSGDTSVFEYMDNGYLPEALMNFLVLLGWNPGEGLKPVSGHPEIFSLQEMIQTFDLEGLQKAPGVFDNQKLRWMNGHYIRSLPLEEIAKRARSFFEKAGDSLMAHTPEWYENLLKAVRAEVDLLGELPAAGKLFFETTPQLDDDARKILADPMAPAVLNALEAELNTLNETILPDEVDQMQKRIGATSGTKGKVLFMSVRAIITGKTHGPELKQILPLLGRAQTMKRVIELRKQAGI